MGNFMRRSTKKRLAIFAGLLVVVGLVLWLGHWTHDGKRNNVKFNIRKYPNLSAMKSLQKKKVPTQPNVVRSRPSSLLMYEDCVSIAEAPIESAKICVYPGKYDTKYSDVLKKGRLFEKDFVLQMTRMLRYDHEMQLVDLGANLGMYTLQAAAWGSKVLAVEQYPDNIRQLQTSLSVSGLSKYVTLVNNAFWSDHRKKTVEHVSRAQISHGVFANIPKKNFNKWGLTKDSTGTSTIYTICMDDLLPLLKHRKVYLKMDLDGDEAEALKCAIKFFDLVDVRVVQMKWVYKTQEDITRIKSFMENEFGFRASRDPRKYVKLSVNSPTAIKGNVYWLPGDLNNPEDDFVDDDDGRDRRGMGMGMGMGMQDEDEWEDDKFKNPGAAGKGMKKIMLSGLVKKKVKKKKSNKQKDKEFRFHQEALKRSKKQKGGIFWKNNMVG